MFFVNVLVVQWIEYLPPKETIRVRFLSRTVIGTKIKILVIVGPTASGKSALAVKLAKEFGGEIISADSRQVYRGLDIGTGKITKREMGGVPHHLLDVVKLSNDRRRQFNVAQYQKLAREKIAEISTRGKLPIVCGGTGLYIQAALGELAIPAIPPNLKLRKRLEKLSTEKLFKKLQKLDPIRAAAIDRHNPRRLVRAIEIAKGRSNISLTVVKDVLDFDPLFIGLRLSPEELRQRIHRRLLKRVKRGLIVEVKNLHDKQKISWRRLEELGLEYRYLTRLLREKNRPTPALPKGEGERNSIAPSPSGRGVGGGVLGQLETAIWHYAKRQMTWFKRDRRIHWLPNARAISELMPKIEAWRSRPKRDNTGTKH